MTKEQVIALARKAADKDKVDPWHKGFCTLTQGELEKFATLVRNAALEGAAQKCEDYGEDSGDLKWMANHLRNLKDKT